MICDYVLSNKEFIFHQVKFTLSEPIEGILKKRNIGRSDKLFLCDGIGGHSNA